MPKVRRALVSVYDKEGVVDLARNLVHHGAEIISTGGTARHLMENGIATTLISEITQFPEILDGRVKTLNPRIFGGLLAVRDNESHLAALREHQIRLIDLVVVNLYPFERTISKDVGELEALENIDIGGPALIRSAAKNYSSIAVVTSPKQYGKITEELAQNDGAILDETRKTLATAAFALTADYDLAIAQYFEEGNSEALFPDRLTLKLEKVQELRYGENPHQKAAFYRPSGSRPSGLANTDQLHGKELSFNNLIDLNSAIGITMEFAEPCAAVIKHTNPCGVATGETLEQAYTAAKAGDPVSAFGGIIGANCEVDGATAIRISEVFTEAIIAPSFSPEALDVLTTKKNLRILAYPQSSRDLSIEYDIKRVEGSLLLQNQDFININDIDLRIVSRRQPDDHDWRAMKFAWRVCKWVKSNAIVFTTDRATVGVGAGQMSRVDASKIAIAKAKEIGHDLKGTTVASDAFFPFRDAVDAAAEAGARCIIQPGGSIRDNEVIDAANEHDLVMVLTGIRHFRH